MVESSEQFVHENQLNLIWQNLLNSLLCNFPYYWFSILDLLSVCTMGPFYFMHYIFRESLNLFLAILYDGQKILALLKLNLIMGFILLRSALNYLLILDPKENNAHAEEVFKKMKIILNEFRVLPLSEHDSITAYLILKKVPAFVWKNLIPFPSFLFEDTFAKSQEGDAIFAQLPPPEPATVLMVKSKANDCKLISASEDDNSEGIRSPPLNGKYSELPLKSGLN